MLPEYQTYLIQNPETAGELTQKEAGLISEIIIQIALSDLKGLNVVVDGSLSDSKWYTNYFHKLRHSYGSNLNIGIVHVTAPLEIIINRITQRIKMSLMCPCPLQSTCPF